MTDLAAGICLIIAATAMSVRVLLLSPGNEGWPPAPQFIRIPMFILACAMFYRGMELVGTPGAQTLTTTTSVVAAALAFYSVTATVNVARQYYPARVWRRIGRIMRLAECENSSVLIALSRNGFRVFLPNSRDPEPIGPADIVDLPDRRV